MEQYGCVCVCVIRKVKGSFKYDCVYRFHVGKGLFYK